MDLDLAVSGHAPPGDVRAFLREADGRIERFRRDRVLPGFVPGDFPRVYAGLRALAESAAAPGSYFCEWGSGFGVVTCLAAMLGFDACGIEAEAELVDAARRLADDFEVPAEFYHGSFIPAEAEALLDAGDGYGWLWTDVVGDGNEAGVGPADFDVVYAYPWPDEERLVERLFRRYAGTGAVLVSYHGGDDLRLRRKTAAKGRPRRR